MGICATSKEGARAGGRERDWRGVGCVRSQLLGQQKCVFVCVQCTLGATVSVCSVNKELNYQPFVLLRLSVLRTKTL